MTDAILQWSQAHPMAFQIIVSLGVLGLAVTYGLERRWNHGRYPRL